MPKRKWSELPAWVRAKITKNNIVKAERAEYEKDLKSQGMAVDWKTGELSLLPVEAGRTITVTPAGKGTPISEACLQKEIRKAQDFSFSDSLFNAISGLPVSDNPDNDRYYVSRNMRGKG